MSGNSTMAPRRIAVVVGRGYRLFEFELRMPAARSHYGMTCVHCHLSGPTKENLHVIIYKAKYTLRAVRCMVTYCGSDYMYIYMHRERMFDVMH